MLKRSGKVRELRKAAFNPAETGLDYEAKLDHDVGIAHTRWATHGVPNEQNSHPQRSDDSNRFIVVHNGIITNYKPIKELLVSHGYTFESDTDTEVVAKLIDHLHKEHPKSNFRELVELLITQVEGAFALAFKSSIFPGEIICTRRGSPLSVGVKSLGEVKSNNVDFTSDYGYY